MARPAIQLYSLRDVDEPVVALLHRVADAGFDGVEFAYRVGDADVNAVVETLDDRELTPVAAHVPVEQLEEDPAGVAAFYRELGCERLVVPALDAEYFESETTVAEAAERLERIAADLVGPGLDLLYHTHQREFATVAGGPGDGERTAFEALVERTERVDFELDVGHAALAGEDPIDLLHRYGHRIPLIHLRNANFDTGEWVPPDEGDVDVVGIGMAAREPGAAGVEWAIYEGEEEGAVDRLPGVAESIREWATRADEQ